MGELWNGIFVFDGPGAGADVADEAEQLVEDLVGHSPAVSLTSDGFFEVVITFEVDVPVSAIVLVDAIAALGSVLRSRGLRGARLLPTAEFDAEVAGA